MNTRIIASFLVVSSFLSLTAIRLNGQSDYYPLISGNRYYYEITATQKNHVGSTLNEQTMNAMIVHLAPAEVNGKLVTPEGRYIDGKLFGVTFIADDDSGIYYFANQNARQKRPVVMDPVQYLIKFPISQGAKWKYNTSGFDMVNDKKLPVTIQAAVESEDEIVSVPAGVFAKCLKIRMFGKRTAASPGAPEFRVKTDLWYAPGLGLVKHMHTEERVADKASSFTLLLELEKVEFGEM